MRIAYVGHSTLLIELDGIAMLTDPVLRRRVAHLERVAAPVDVRSLAAVDLVLISHLHHDHFDPPSLRMLDRRATLVVPRGTGKAAARLAFRRTIELREGETFATGDVEVTATHAEHRGGRLLDRRSKAMGFLVAGTQRVYFAGDTDLFSEMRGMGETLDVALLPVGGWGPRLGSGHLDPVRAAEALTLLEPRVAVPIHWGTLHRIRLRRSLRQMTTDPPRAFAREAAIRAPSVDVRVLAPGAATTVEPAEKP